MPEMTVPLISRGNGRWGSPSPAWDHLINRESSGIPDIIQQIRDVNSGGNEAEGLFQITPKTWRGANGQQFAPSARAASPQQQAIVAARIFTRNPTGSDWGAGRPGREDPKQLAAGLVPLNPNQTQETPVAWTGDPVWLPDILRDAGLVCHIYPGAFERGHGDMGQIWGVMAHHTGSFGETPRGIAQHPTLGLASQLYLGRNGEYTLCGVGKAWHGGNGSYPGISDVNAQLIGIEAANDGGGTPGKPHRFSWSDVQYDAYVTGVAAILNKLSYGADRCIGHKEWAGRAQGKWDPGAIDMNLFRADIAERLAGGGIWDSIYREIMGEI